MASFKPEKASLVGWRWCLKGRNVTHISNPKSSFSFVGFTTVWLAEPELLMLVCFKDRPVKSYVELSWHIEFVRITEVLKVWYELLSAETRLLQSHRKDFSLVETCWTRGGWTNLSQHWMCKYLPTTSMITVDTFQKSLHHHKKTQGSLLSCKCTPFLHRHARSFPKNLSRNLQDVACLVQLKPRRVKTTSLSRSLRICTFHSHQAEAVKRWKYYKFNILHLHLLFIYTCVGANAT